jgi:hypothetical protein
MIGVTLPLAAIPFAAVLVRDLAVPGQRIAPPSGWTATGEALEAAEMVRTCDVAHGGRCSARLAAGPGSGMIVMVQTVSAARYAGSRVVLAGWVKTEAASAAQLWLRVDAGRTVVALDNMSDRPISSTTPWTEYRLVLDVPDGATALAFGLLVHAGGQAWVDDLSLTLAERREAATTDVLPTRRVFRHDLETLSSATPRLPVNLDFER